MSASVTSICCARLVVLANPVLDADDVDGGVRKGNSIKDGITAVRVVRNQAPVTRCRCVPMALNEHTIDALPRPYAIYDRR